MNITHLGQAEIIHQPNKITKENMSRNIVTMKPLTNHMERNMETRNPLTEKLMNPKIRKSPNHHGTLRNRAPPLPSLKEQKPPLLNQRKTMMSQ